MNTPCSAASIVLGARAGTRERSPSRTPPERTAALCTQESGHFWKTRGAPARAVAARTAFAPLPPNARGGPRARAPGSRFPSAAATRTGRGGGRTPPAARSTAAPAATLRPPGLSRPACRGWPPGPAPPAAAGRQRGTPPRLPFAPTPRCWGPALAPAVRGLPSFTAGRMYKCRRDHKVYRPLHRAQYIRLHPGGPKCPSRSV